jgi:hypothetical protein
MFIGLIIINLGGNMKQKRFIVLTGLVLILCFTFIGCFQPQITPIDRALIYNNQYEALETTYKNHYTVATNTEKEWMSEHVAPVIDKMRTAVARYTRLALIGEDDETTRIEIIQLYRKAAIQLTQEVL